MDSFSPVCNKIHSFFSHGAISGDKLEEVKQQGIHTTGSYDPETGGILALNCISKAGGIARSLFQQAANSGLSVATEESVGSGGIIDEVLQRRSTDIQEYEAKLRPMFSNVTTIESASLKNIICEDQVFIANLEKKTHQTALFIFNIIPSEDDLSEIGCKEIKRQGISPDKITHVLIPEKYREVIEKQGPMLGIPMDKVVFVPDKQEAISISYKDAQANTPFCTLKNPIHVPDYETFLNDLRQKAGNKPIYTHMTRLPE